MNTKAMLYKPSCGKMLQLSYCTSMVPGVLWIYGSPYFHFLRKLSLSSRSFLGVTLAGNLEKNYHNV